MGREAKLMQDVAHLVIVVAFVQTQPLWLIVRRVGSLNDKALESGAHQFHVMPISAVQHQTNREAVAFGQQTAFAVALAAIGRVRPCFFPYRGPWSSRHPYSASASRCPLGCRHLLGASPGSKRHGLPLSSDGEKFVPLSRLQVALRLLAVDKEGGCAGEFERRCRVLGRGFDSG
jgi:hypothetical protein